MIEQIMSFTAVVEAGSFSEAGRRLGQSKSTVSQRVQQLEQRLGVRLLQRSTRAVRPTDVGRAYYDRCVRILAEVEEADLVVRQDQVVPTGTLRIHLPIELGMLVLGGFMADFLVANPNVSLELELTSRHIDLIEEKFDLAVRIGTMPSSSLISRKILGIERAFHVSQDYLGKFGEPESTEDLRRHSCLKFRTDYHPGDWVMTGPQGRSSFPPAGRVVANNLTVLREAAISGLGIALLPRFLCREAEAVGLLRRILLDWTPEDAEAYLLYPSRRHLSAKVRSFVSFLDLQMDRLAELANGPSPDGKR